MFSLFKNFQSSQYLTKICFKYIWKGKIIAVSVGFLHMTYRFIVYALTLCTMLLDNYFGEIKLSVYMTLLCILIESMSQV